MSQEQGGDGGLDAATAEDGMFALVRELTESQIAWARSDEAQGLEHGVLEEHVLGQGFEWMRLLTQGYLRVRAAREQRRTDVTDADGDARVSAVAGQEHTRTMVSGDVVTERIAYKRHRKPALFPQDADLNWPARHGYPAGVVRRVASMITGASAERTAAQISAATAITLGKRQVEELAVGAAADFGAFYAARVRGDPPGKPAAPRATGKTVLASVIKPIPVMIGEGFDEALRRDPQRLPPWYAVVDGNNSQITAINKLAGRHQVKVPVLIDFIHAVQYLRKAAASFFDPGDPAARTWVIAQAAKLLAGKARDVRTGIRRRATTYGYRGAERKGADVCATYLENKRDYLVPFARQRDRADAGKNARDLAPDIPRLALAQVNSVLTARPRRSGLPACAGHAWPGRYQTPSARCTPHAAARSGSSPTPAAPPGSRRFRLAAGRACA
jgi:hypothetical protein